VEEEEEEDPLSDSGEGFGFEGVGDDSSNEW